MDPVTVCLLLAVACDLILLYAVCTQRRIIWLLTGRGHFRRSYMTPSQAQRLYDLLDGIGETPRPTKRRRSLR